MVWNTVFAVTVCLMGVWLCEANVLHRSVESVGTEGQRAKTTANQIQQVADKLTIDLNKESLAPKDAENRRQTLEEELEFMRNVNEQGSGLSSTANRTRRATSMTTETKKTPDGFLRSNEMSDIFLKFDVNGDGAIDETEFIDNWSILKLGDPDYARLFYFFNRNVDGKISEAEFLSVWFSQST